jgi:hypothetical protein
MTTQHPLPKGAVGESATSNGSGEWNASLISRKPVRMEFTNPGETESECQKHIFAALWVFLGLIIVLTIAVVYLMWVKVH